MLDIGIIIPSLAHYSGAERLAVECIARWQHDQRLSVYATEFDLAFLKEHRVDEQLVRLHRLTPRFEGANSDCLNAVLLPKIWEQEIGDHEVYHAHQWPTHLIERSPLVWYPHEPNRSLFDLRYDGRIDRKAASMARDLASFDRISVAALADIVREGQRRSIRRIDPLGWPDRIVANSRYTARYLEEIYGRAVTDIVYPGVDLQPALTEPVDSNLIAVVGRLDRQKRIDVMLEAIELVPDAELHVIGRGREREKLERMANRLGIGKRVFFREGLSNLEVRRLVARCLALLFLPVREPFGIVALEAMAMGKPLIAVWEGGFTEVLDDNCALLVPPEPGAVARAICHLRENPELVRSMGLAGRLRARAYSWDRTARELLSILEETCRKPASATTAPATKEAAPRFGVQYYCWFVDGPDNRTWPDDHGRVDGAALPTLGRYDSARGTIIRSHLRIIQDAGFDFVVLNLHPGLGVTSAHELIAVEHILGVADQIGSSLQFAIRIWPDDCSRQDLAVFLSVVRRFHVREANYLRIGSQPTLFVAWSGKFEGDGAWFEHFEESTRGMTRIACSAGPNPHEAEPSPTFSQFEGRSLASLPAIGPAESWEAGWRRACLDGSAGPAGLKILLLSAGASHSVRPFDPEIVKLREREYSGTLALASKAADSADLVLISSFNGFHDGTYIEASTGHGTQLLEMTREFILHNLRPK
jgi:glycosyltransferase involved in cell wall biosynthesis